MKFKGELIIKKMNIDSTIAAEQERLSNTEFRHFTQRAAFYCRSSLTPTFDMINGEIRIGNTGTVGPN